MCIPLFVAEIANKESVELLVTEFLDNRKLVMLAEFEGFWE